MTPELQSVFLFIVIFGMLLGLASLLLVFVPGVIIIWLSILAYGLVTGFTWPSGIIFAVITLLMIFSTIIDNVIMGATTREQGTSWLAIGVSMAVLLVAGIFLTPVVGLLISFLAVFLVEFLRVRDWRKALASLRGMATGCGLSVVVRIGIGLLMIGLWLIWYLAKL
jgi:uncharacterized protein YqgC (DUF456 family)